MSPSPVAKLIVPAEPILTSSPVICSLPEGLVVPIPTLPLSKIERRATKPASPPGEFWKSNLEPFSTSKVAGLLPLKTKLPEVDASPFTSRAALVVVVPMPKFPALFTIESALPPLFCHS